MENIPIIHFYKHKYGKELLADVVNISFMIKYGLHNCTLHRYDCYAISLITKGEEYLSINTQVCKVEKGYLIISSPSDIWQWQQSTKLQGYMLLFEEHFLSSFFTDRQMLKDIVFLKQKESKVFFQTSDKLYSRLVSLLEQMQEEIHSAQALRQNILRAMLYEFLIHCSRCITNENKQLKPAHNNRFIEPFMKAVEKNFKQHRNITFYANKLCITPNYLNKLSHIYFGMSAKDYINNYVISEIKNSLCFTDKSINEIGEEFGFYDVSYFIRFFKRHTTLTPLQFRKQQ